MNGQLQGKQLLLFISLSIFFSFGSLVMTIVENDSEAEILATITVQKTEILSTSVISKTLAPTNLLPSPTISSSTPSPTITPISCDIPIDWTPYEIEVGETLVMIAEFLLLSPDIIIEGNCLDGPLLEEGDILFLPSASTTTITPEVEFSTPTVTSTTEATDCGAEDDWGTYTVVQGDTLYRVSNAYGVTIKEIQFANCMGDFTSLITGTIINVPNITPNFPTVAP